MLGPYRDAVLQAAEQYAALGWVPLPVNWVIHTTDGPKCSCGSEKCRHMGKHPLAAFTTLRTPAEGLAAVRHAIEARGCCNLAIRTGRESNLLVFDLDDKHGQKGSANFDDLCRSLEIEAQALATIRARTGSGGAHLFFLMPTDDAPTPCRTNHPAQSVDVRADNGYVLVAPSNHSSGGTYSWTTPPATRSALPPPVLLVEAARAKRSRVGARPQGKAASDHGLIEPALRVAIQKKVLDLASNIRALPFPSPCFRLRNDLPYGIGRYTPHIVDAEWVMRELTAAWEAQNPRDGDQSVAWHDEALETTREALQQGAADPWLPPTERVARRDLQELAKKFRRRERPYDKKLARAFRRVIEGEDYGAELTQGLLRAVVDELPDGDSEDVAKLFTPSVEVMADVDTDAIGRGVRELREAKQRQLDQQWESIPREKLVEETNLWILEASSGRRDRPYSEDELQAFAREAGVSLEFFMQRLIIRVGTSHYVFHEGQYVGPFVGDELFDQCRLYLAAVPEVDVYKRTKQGRRRKSAGELTESYGVAGRGVIADRAAQRSYYDASQHRLVEAPSPLRELPERYDHRVDHWLQLLGGPMADKLLDWLATSPRLANPTSALLLIGKRQTGKGLLASGLASLWTADGPVPLASAFKQFNSAILRCPVLFGDERLPSDFRGRTQTEELRELIQSRSYRFERKYHPEATILGAFRVVLAANNEGFFDVQASLNQHDVEAIAERILHIPVGDGAMAYLKGLKERGDPILPDDVAMHIRHLAGSRDVVPGSRLLVEGGSESTVRTLAIRSHDVSLLCQQILDHLLRARPLPGGVAEPAVVHVENGQLLVRAKEIFESWPDEKLDGRRRPTLRRLEMALSTVSSGRVSRTLPPLRGMRRAEVKLRVVKIEYLVAWAEDHGYATREQIEEILKADALESDG